MYFNCPGSKANMKIHSQRIGGFQLVPAQTGLYCQRRWLEALYAGFTKEGQYYLLNDHYENLRRNFQMQKLKNSLEKF